MRTRAGSASGLRALRSMAIQTSCGDCVPISWTRRAESRQTMAFGHGRRDHGDGLELVRLGLGEPVEPAPDLLDRALGDEPLELAERHPERRHVPGPEEGPDPAAIQASLGQARVVHAGTLQMSALTRKCRHLMRSLPRSEMSAHHAQVPTFYVRPAPPVTSASIRTMSFSIARMSASISSSGRGGV